MNKKEYINQLQQLITEIEKNDFNCRFFLTTLNDPILSKKGVEFMKKNLINILVRMTFLKPNGDKKKKIKYLAYFESYVGLVYYDTIKKVDLYKWLEDIFKLGEQNEK